MQFSAVEIRFILTTYIYSTFTNDLKRILFFFRKMFIVAEYAALKCEIRAQILQPKTWSGDRRPVDDSLAEGMLN